MLPVTHQDPCGHVVETHHEIHHPRVGGPLIRFRETGFLLFGERQLLTQIERFQIGAGGIPVADLVAREIAWIGECHCGLKKGRLETRLRRRSE